MARSDEIREHISRKIEHSRALGEESLTLVSGDIAREMKLKNRMPMVCGAMDNLMGTGSEVVHTTPSGYSSTIAIRYLLK